MLASTYVGVDPCASRLEHTDGPAASFAAAVLGLASALTTNRSAVPCNATTGMECTYAAAVFPSTVLGCAHNAATTATACGLVLAARHGAALGQHVVARDPPMHLPLSPPPLLLQ